MDEFGEDEMSEEIEQEVKLDKRGRGVKLNYEYEYENQKRRATSKSTASSAIDF